MYFIVPLTKSSYFGGRFGPVEKQDWYQTLVKAKSLLQWKPSKILIITAVHMTGEKSEMECSMWALKKLGVEGQDIIAINEAQETIGQLKIAAERANKYGAKLLIVSTFLHYLRVRWLCRGLNARHYIVWGIPRPRDVFWDTVLDFAFPIVDMLGQREWFLEKIRARRESGKL